MKKTSIFFDVSFRLRPLRRALAVFILIAGAACVSNRPPISTLSPEDAGDIRFFSVVNLVRQQPLQPRQFAEGPPQIVRGNLKFPEKLGPLPAVIMLHGCGGLVWARDTRWQRLLIDWGYATFAVDSFTDRGLKEVCVTPSLLNQVQRVPDVYGALRLLATHPRIDPENIFVMGWSHGAGVALESATVWAEKTFRQNAGPRLKGAIALYPNCNIYGPEREEIAVPIRIHSGALDNATLAEPCVRYAENLRNAGHDAQANVYAEAKHGFDTPNTEGVYPTALVLGYCPTTERSILGSYTIPKGCEKRGFSYGYNKEAATAAEINVRNQLQELIQSKPLR